MNFMRYYKSFYLILFLAIGKTIPINIAKKNDVRQSTIAPFFSINKFHNNVTRLAAAKASRNVIITLKKMPFVFILAGFSLVIVYFYHFY